MKNILRAAKKSKDPSRIAYAYGILVDKVPKSYDKLLAEINKVTKTLLNEIGRAAKESNDPNSIAVALGIIIDKKFYGGEKPREDKKTKASSAKSRKATYREILADENKNKS